MKGVSIPAAVIMPSPLFLWQFKKAWDSIMRMSMDLRVLFLYEVFLYYNPILLVALMIWSWGVNLWVFARSSVNYAKVFDLAQPLLSHREIWSCATWLTLIVPTSMTAYLYLYSHGEVSLAASTSVILYAILLMILFSPFDMFYISSRFYFLSTVAYNTAFTRQQDQSTFLTFLLGRYFYIHVKVCRMVNRQVATIAWFEADSICGSHSIAIPLVLMFPTCAVSSNVSDSTRIQRRRHVS
ncbi:unnamed protein product [Urochloa humidicola]